MEHGADHIENDSPSEHGNETPRLRTRSPTASTTYRRLSLTSRAHYVRPPQPGQLNLLDDADATSWTTPFYALPRRASSSASRPGITTGTTTRSFIPSGTTSSAARTSATYGSRSHACASATKPSA